MYYEYYMNRNLDDLYKKYLPILHICICQKYKNKYTEKNINNNI